MVPQETHAPFDFTVLDIVLMGRFPHLGTFALEGPEDLSIAKQALASTGTSAFEDRPFATLSGGEKQRVVIASALAQSPNSCSSTSRRLRSISAISWTSSCCSPG